MGDAHAKLLAYPSFSCTRTRQNGEEFLTQIAAAQKFGGTARGTSYLPQTLCPRTKRALSENRPIGACFPLQTHLKCSYEPIIAKNLGFVNKWERTFRSAFCENVQSGFWALFQVRSDVGTWSHFPRDTDRCLAGCLRTKNSASVSLPLG